MLSDHTIADAEHLIAAGRPGDAVARLSEMLAAGRGGLLLRLTLQKALLAAGDSVRALELARETALSHPTAAAASLALGEALQARGHLPTAIAEYQRALRLDPHLDSARLAIGSAWLDAGEAEKALDAWRGLPDTSELAESIRDAEQTLGASRSDARYVRHLFDQFSADYDSRMLGQLRYGAPAILRELAEFVGLDATKKYAILDLGCGTGLMGEAVRDLAARLDGIDLSPAMLEKARARGIYDELAVADICPWLETPGCRYDLVFAADTLVYLGDLANVFMAVAARLGAAGRVLFTVEQHHGEGFELGPRRRWRHSDSYLRRVAGEAGLAVRGLMPCAPRSERGAPVDGLAVALAKR